MDEKPIILTREVIDRLDEVYKEDPIAFIEDNLWIQVKEGGIKRFKLNGPQRMLIETMEKQRKAGLPIRVIILKARQIGFSTVVQAYIFWWLTRNRYTAGLVIAHENDASVNLWSKFVLFLNRMLPEFAPKVKRKDEARGRLELGTDDPAKAPFDPCYGSTLKIESAQDKEAGRSGTYQLVHASEVAFWPWPQTFLALKQTVANVPGTLFVEESTANGASGQFYEDWMAAKAGKTNFIPVFVAWWEHEEYRLKTNPQEDEAWVRFKTALAKAVEEGQEDWKKHLDWEPDGVIELDEEEMELAKTYPIDYGQIKWRRWCIQENCGGDKDKFCQEYPASDDEAFLQSGRPFFDSRQVRMLKEWLKSPDNKGPKPVRYTIDESVDPEEGKPLSEIIYPDPFGELTVWEKPQPGKEYAIGADVAEGTADGDFNAGHVVENESMAHVAQIHGKFDPDIFGKKLYWLGMWYNEALLGVELNQAGHATIQTLEQMGYDNLWGQGWPIRSRMKGHGWRTDIKSRRPMLNHFKRAFVEKSFVPRSPELLDEMLTFVLNDKGKPEAQSGKHDDLVMAMAITLQMREKALENADFAFV